MTLDQWIDRVSGYTVTIPAGTDASRYIGHRTILETDRQLTITLDHGAMRDLVNRALTNKSRRAIDGPITVRADRPRQP